MRLDISQNELELLKKAVSFLKSNVPAAEESLDETISESELIELEEKIYEVSK